jgi:hypothetical protein
MNIPLFPLHTVLSPGLALPIHVFEERYRVLVRHCIDRASPFGVVLIREGSEVAPGDGRAQELSIASVGTLAEIREASQHRDGRWDLLTVGVGRFAIRAVRTDVEPYLVADVEALDDDDGDADEAAALVARVTRRFVDYLRLLQPQDGEAADPIDVQVEVEVPDASDDEGLGDPDDDERRTGGESPDLASALRVPDDPSQLSFLLTGIIQVEAARKQALLEAPDPAARLRGLDSLLDRELALLRARLAPYLVDGRATGSRTS